MKIKRSTLTKIQRIIKISFYVFVIVGLIYLLFWFLFGDISKINNVEVIGATPVAKNMAVKPLITEAIRSEKRLYFIPANHIATFDKNKIIEIINKELPNVESINIKTEGLHTLNIEITSRTPAFNLADRKVLDKHGVAYSELSGTTTLPFLNSSSTPTEAEIKTMTDFMKRITTRLFDVSVVEITKDKDIYFFDKKHNTALKYHKGDDTNMLWNTFISALDTPPLSDLLQNKKSALEYVDLRFGNKVFYKFKTEDKNQIVPNTATSTKLNN